MDLMEKLEQYISEDEISQPRTAIEYILWFESKLGITKERREELKKQNILHIGVAKVFYEELFPLYRLLQNKLKEWSDLRFKPGVGNQNYDVEVEAGRGGVPQYIEIVVADRNEEEHARMEYFLNYGQVNMIGDVLIMRDKKNGKTISVDEEAHSSAEINRKIENRISELINKKMAVTERPNNTALLVFFDDYTAFRYDLYTSKPNMDAFLDSIKVCWQNRYSALYVVGASGNSLWQRTRKGVLLAEMDKSPSPVANSDLYK